MRFVRGFLRWFVLITALLLAVLAWLLFTETGARWTVAAVQSRMAQLSVEVRDGTFWRGLDLANIEWSMAGAKVSARHVGVRWRLDCLPDSLVCLDTVRSDGLAVRIDPERLVPAAPEADAEPAGKLDLPVAIRIADLKLVDTRVAIVGGPTVELERLSSGAELRGSDLAVDTTQVAGFAIRLPASSGDEPAPANGDPAASTASASASDGLALPLSVDLEGLRLRDFTFGIEGGVQVALARLDTALTLDDQALTVAATQAESLSVELPTAAPPPPSGEDQAAAPDGGPSSRLELPLAIRLQGLDLQNASIDVAEGPSVALSRMTTGLSAQGDRLDLAPTRLSGLRVELPEGGAGEAPAEQSTGDEPLVIDPPKVALPLDIGIEGMTLTDAVLVQSGISRRLDRLQLAGALVGQRLTLAQLEASAPPGRVAASGQVTMADDWPLNLSVDVQADDLPELGQQQLRGSLSGSLADLGLQVEANGGVDAQLSATAELFSPDIPWTASLEASAVQWPLGDEPVARATDLSVSGQGSITKYRLELTTALAGPDIPAGQWRLALAGDTQGARIEQLEGQLLGGELAIAGDVGWAPNPSWDLTLEGSGLEPGRWRERLADTRLSTRARVAGALESDGWRLDAVLESLDARWQDRSLTASGRVQHGLDGSWQVDELVARVGANRVRVHGRVGERWDLTTELALSRLAQLAPELDGRLEGDLAVTGERMAPSVRGGLTGDGLAWRAFALQRGELAVRVDRLMQGSSDISLALKGVSRDGEPLGDLDVGLTGTRSEHRLRVAGTKLPRAMAADLTVAGGLDTGGDRPTWSGRIEAGRLALPDGEWRLASAASLRVELAPLSLELGRHCWQRQPARLCIGEPATWGPAGRRLVADLASFPLKDLEAFLPKTTSVNGDLNATVSADWPAAERPSVSLTANARKGTVTLAPEDELQQPLAMDYERLNLGVELDPAGAEIRFDLASKELGTGEVRVSVDPYSADQAINGPVRLDGLRLEPLQAFLPALDELAGRISVDGELDGSLTKPGFRGRVRLTNGTVAVRGLSVPITAIGVTANVAGDRARIEGSLRSGEGTAQVSGDIGWSDGLSGSVALVGEGLEFGYLPVVRRLSLDPDLNLSFGDEAIELTGRLGVPSGRLAIGDLPQGSVSVSRDAVIVGDDDQIGEPGGLTLKSKVQLVLGDDVRFTGMGAEGRLTGALTLRQIGAAGTEANGEIRLVDARYEAYGQKLAVRTGRFLFAGPIGEPRLDIEAVRDTGEVIAGLRISGSAQQPEVTVFSEPPMAQADALTYLLTGSGPGEGSASDQDLLAKAAVSLGVFGGDKLGSAVANQLGVEDFRLGASGSGEDTQVRVSGRIAPNLVVSYGVGVFRPENTFTVRYQLTRRFFLEAVTGLDSALDIFYSVDF
jgi:translocation and assembly module TamB